MSGVRVNIPALREQLSRPSAHAMRKSPRTLAAFVDAVEQLRRLAERPSNHANYGEPFTHQDCEVCRALAVFDFLPPDEEKESSVAWQH